MSTDQLGATSMRFCPLSNGLRPIPPPCQVGCSEDCDQSGWGLGLRVRQRGWFRAADVVWELLLAVLGAQTDSGRVRRLPERGSGDGGLLGASWGPIGASWGSLGGLLGPLGGLLRSLGGLLGPLGGSLGASWGLLGAYWGLLGAHWGGEIDFFGSRSLSLSWVPLGAFLGPSGLVLGLS